MSNQFIIPVPDDSLQCFEKLKQATIKSWRRIEIADNCYGFQTQARSKCRNGLSESALAEFERAMG